MNKKTQFTRRKLLQSGFTSAAGLSLMPSTAQAASETFDQNVGDEYYAYKYATTYGKSFSVGKIHYRNKSHYGEKCQKFPLKGPTRGSENFAQKRQSVGDFAVGFYFTCN